MSVVAVVPAAGASRRMGRDKLLLPWGDTVVIGAVLEALEGGGATRLVVVVSPGNDALETWLSRRSCRTAVNADPGRGMLSSIQEGLLALGGAEGIAARGDTLLVCPGDLPGIDPRTVEALIGLVEGGAALAVPVYAGRRGHPLAISAALASEIPRLDPEIGLRQLVLRHADRLTELEAQHAGVVRDLDTPADYDAARRGKPVPDPDEKRR